MGFRRQIHSSIVLCSLVALNAYSQKWGEEYDASNQRFTAAPVSHKGLWGTQVRGIRYIQTRKLARSRSEANQICQKLGLKMVSNADIQFMGRLAGESPSGTFGKNLGAIWTSDSSCLRTILNDGDTKTIGADRWFFRTRAWPGAPIRDELLTPFEREQETTIGQLRQMAKENPSLKKSLDSRIASIRSQRPSLICEEDLKGNQERIRMRFSMYKTPLSSADGVHGNGDSDFSGQDVIKQIEARQAAQDLRALTIREGPNKDLIGGMVLCKSR